MPELPTSKQIGLVLIKFVILMYSVEKSFFYFFVTLRCTVKVYLENKKMIMLALEQDTAPH